MTVTESLNIIKNMFSPNGYSKDGFSVKLPHPIRFSVSVTGKTIVVSFDDETYPIVTYEKSLKILKPFLSRKLSEIVFTESEITLKMLNCPDFSFNYS